MSKRADIISHADLLIKKKGFNAFSFHEISSIVGIKTASIHYHFPTKSDLGTAVVNRHIENLNGLIERLKNEPVTVKLEGFFSIYDREHGENNVCVVGSLATDFHTLDGSVQSGLKKLADMILNWVSDFLEVGRRDGRFRFEGLARTKALMIITNMLASVQLTRLTNQDDFERIKECIRKDLIEETK